MWRLLFIGLLLTGAAEAEEHSITIAGTEELVLSHDDMNCGKHDRGGGDVTDVPVNAFRRSDNSVVVLIGNQSNYFMEGPSLEEAKRTSCASLIEPVNSSDPATFENRRWLFGIYAKSYDFVLGFVHNEYHGFDFFPEGCAESSPRDRECWYGSAGLVVSHDGGFKFETPPPPDNVLAALPFRFEAGRKRAGANTPKVVGNPQDGMVYVLINYLDRGRDIGAEQCLLRGSGTAFNDWRAWDGEGFNLDMESPYSIERSGADCAPVLSYPVHSVKYVPLIGQFVSLGVRGRQLVYAFSSDLIHWSAPTMLMEFQQKQNWQPGMAAARSYFSLLDPKSSSINFDTLEGSPYLYFVQYGTDGKRTFRRERDVYRVPITIK